MSSHPRQQLLLVVILLAVIAGSGCGVAASDDEQPADPKPAATTTATTVPESDPATESSPAASLPIEKLVGELVMTKLVATTASDEELEAVRRLHVGGIILFGPSVVDEPQLRALLESLDEARAAAASRAGLPAGLLVSVDQEGGPIRNVPFAPPAYRQPEIATQGHAEARAHARATGIELARVGISMDLGPVADLVQPPNRTMAGRSFGSDAASVSPFVASTVEGLEMGGVAAVAKHFPGFGASTENSDNGIAYVDRTRAQLRAEELAPFRAAIDAGVDAIMVSHGIHRSLGSNLPGTLDPKISTKLLRDELGFEGVAMTDSMNAKGFRDAWGDTVPRACPVALAAGIDLLLLTGTIETARLCRDRVIEAVRDGTLEESRVREAAGRIIELRGRVAARGSR